MSEKRYLKFKYRFIIIRRIIKPVDQGGVEILKMIDMMEKDVDNARDQRNENKVSIFTRISKQFTYIQWWFILGIYYKTILKKAKNKKENNE